MVGHTHEDIDARFAVIWNALRLQHLLSPQSYTKAIVGAFDQKIPVKVEDIWVVPNYTHYFSKSIDKKFGRYAKKEWTQLQFIFEAVEQSSDFPEGVRTTYRRYAADSVIEIEASAEAKCGFTEKECITQTYPAAKPATEDSPARPAGMYILKEATNFPEMIPCGFKERGREEYNETLKKVEVSFQKDVVEEWREFDKLVPLTDDVNTYLDSHPNAMHIPLKEILFQNVAVASAEGVLTVHSNAAKNGGRQRNTVVATESVLWSNRGDHANPVKCPTVPICMTIPVSAHTDTNIQPVSNDITTVSIYFSILNLTLLNSRTHLEVQATKLRNEKRKVRSQNKDVVSKPTAETATTSSANEHASNDQAVCIYFSTFRRYLSLTLPFCRKQKLLINAKRRICLLWRRDRLMMLMMSMMIMIMMIDYRFPRAKHCRVMGCAECNRS